MGVGVASREREGDSDVDGRDAEDVAERLRWLLPDVERRRYELSVPQPAPSPKETPS
jgi:hypothetical protein